MVRVYIIRHGETEPNTRFACLGRLDVPLNSVGHEQAQCLASRLNGVIPDKIYTSPLLRAYETIAPYHDIHPEIPVISEQGIIERDFGIWDNMTFKEIEAAYPAEYDMWQKDFIGYTIPCGESSYMVQERINTALNSIMPENEDKTIFFVTHLGTARQLISRLLGLSISESWRFTMDNGAYAVIDYDNNTRTGVLKYLNI